MTTTTAPSVSKVCARVAETYTKHSAEMQKLAERLGLAKRNQLAGLKLALEGVDAIDDALFEASWRVPLTAELDKRLGLDAKSETDRKRIVASECSRLKVAIIALTNKLEPTEDESKNLQAFVNGVRPRAAAAGVYNMKNTGPKAPTKPDKNRQIANERDIAIRQLAYVKGDKEMTKIRVAALACLLTEENWKAVIELACAIVTDNT
jgi:hypothetical protein